MRLLLAGGGTGGHLFPAVALGERLLETDKAGKVHFVGTARGMEAKVLPQLGLPLTTIDITGWSGKTWPERIKVFGKMIGSMFEANRILRQFRPDVVVGTGGYASGPVLAVARLRGYPTVILEQNAELGLTNRLLAPWMDRVCVSLPEAADRIGKNKGVWTGNPLRRGMERGHGLPPDDPPALLIFGGSQGARAINDAMTAALPELAAWRGRLKILHQTGEEDRDRIAAAYRQAGWEDAEIVPFIRDMAAAYHRAHLVVCRAGATTLAELTACGRPAILIPFPEAARDHQTANARVLSLQGAGILLSQADLDGESLGAAVQGLLGDRGKLEEMARVASKLGRPGAADRVLNECRALLSQRGN